MPVYPSPARGRAALCSAVAALLLVTLAACGRRISEEPEPGATSSASSASTAAPTTGATARAIATAPPRPAAPANGEGWNAAQIDWQSYEVGLKLAKTTKKPVCLVFFTSWCPHCKNFSHVFDDPRVVTRAHDFVMIHLDADAEEAVASKYALDGSYIPRTFFLAPDGTVDDSIHAPRPRSRYFYDEHDPSALLAAMDTARQKLVN
jgi:thiol:disulfide interchange protein